MTVLTVPAQPGRHASVEPPPVRWQGMLWITWRQHRGLLISVLAIYIIAAIAMPIEGLKIRHDYAILAACRPAGSPACVQLGNWFNTDWHAGNGIRVALLAVLLLLALFAGPPVIARDLENGTYRYAWSQGMGRVRWTAAKLTLLALVVTIPAFAISQLFSWLFTPFLTTQDITVLSPAVFITRGVVYPAWTLTAFCLGAFLGALVRRVITAMAVTLGGYLALAAVTWLYLRDHYPVRTFWPMQFFEAGWLLILSVLLIAGTVRLVRRHAA